MHVTMLATVIDAWAIGISLAVFLALVLLVVALLVGWRGWVAYKKKKEKKEQNWKKEVQGTVIRPNPSYVHRRRQQ